MHRHAAAVGTGVVIAALALGATSARADYLIVDQNFDADTLGVRPTSSAPSGFPMTQPQALGAFIDIFDGGPTVTETNPPAAVDPTIAANNITFDTQNVAGFNKALVVTVGAAADVLDVDVPFYDNNFNAPLGEAATVRFEFAQLANPGGDNGGFRSDFLLVAFRSAGPQHVFAIGTKHDTPGQIFLQYNDGVNVPIGTYTLGQAVAVEMHVRYLTGRFDVYLDGSLAASNMPFMNPITGNLANDVIKELFFQFVGATGGTNSVAIDNVQYIIETPEPATAALTILGLAFTARRSRRR